MNLEEGSRLLPLTTRGSPGLYEPGSIAPPPRGGSGTAALCVESRARECGRARTHSPSAPASELGGLRRTLHPPSVLNKKEKRRWRRRFPPPPFTDP